MSQEPPLPSQVRARVLADHAELRKSIAEIRSLLGAPTGRLELPDESQLAVATRALLDSLEAHLALEDQILLPTLATIDAWGPERARKLSAEHAAQRETLSSLRALLSTEGAWTFVPRLQRFLDRLERDMELEEAEELDESLLREYPIRADLGGG